MEYFKKNIAAYAQAMKKDAGAASSPAASAFEAFTPDTAPFTRITRTKEQPSADTSAGGKEPPPVVSAPFAGLLKRTEKDKEPSVRKAAKFLMLIGKEEAAKVMRHLAAAEVEAIAQEIAGIHHIENAEAEKILAEFGFLRETLRFPAGGVDTARRILVNAFGEEKGRDILARSVPADEEKFFGFLEDFEPQQLHLLVKNESPAVLAVIFPYLRAETVSKVLPLFERDFRRGVIQRMAKTEKISRDVLARMEEALREKARSLSAPSRTQDVDGKGILAEILKYVDVSQEEEILKNIGDDDPLIAEEIKERLFTIDVLDYMDDEDLQKILRDMADREIALLLKGKADGVRAKILTHVSERRRTFVTDEYRFLGAVPRKDVDTATRDFLNVLKRLEDEGEIIFRRENDVWVK